MASPPASLSAEEFRFEITRVWSCLWRIFPFFEKIFRTGNINNDHQNAFTLDVSLHTPFGAFAFSLAPATLDNEYEIMIFEPDQLSLVFLEKYSTGTFIPGVYNEPNGSQAILPPNRDMFDVHCTIARVLHASGAVHRIEEYLREIESVDTLAEDGSTAFTDYLTSKLANARCF